MNIANIDKEDRGDLVRAMILENAREVIFESKEHTENCPTCSGNDPFCPLCHGTNRVVTTSLINLLATVRWKSGNQQTYKSYGVIIDGDCVVVVPHNDYAFGIVSSAKAVIIDGARFVIKSYHVRGSPPNRISVTLLQDTKSG